MTALGLVATLLGATPPASAQMLDGVLVDAREALRRKDGERLAVARDALVAVRHPLAMWADYWEFTNRIATAQQPEFSAFSERWSGTYVEDRLRNDWLLELGHRRDWANFGAEFPRFRMNDDREVTCYAQIVEHQAGRSVRAPALAAWLAQRDADEGCALMAEQLFAARVFGAADVWRKVRAAADAGKGRAARQAVALLGDGPAAALADAWDNPARFLARRSSAPTRADAELATVALVRMAQSDANVAAAQMSSRWDRALPTDLAGWAWSAVAKRAALALLPEAADLYRRAQQRAAPRDRRDANWPDDTLAWKVRASLRADDGRPRWRQVLQAIDAMSPAEQADPSWVYWKGRAMLALAGDSSEPGADAQRDAARALLRRIAGGMHYYGQLAADLLGHPVAVPARPAPPTDDERHGVARHHGLQRALQLIALGLRSEGVREWNYSLRGMDERELLAAAELACEHQVWDRCISTSERTRDEVDVEQRFPVPHRDEVMQQASAIGLDPAYVYGLIRQESRFVTDARSGAGASGLMQLMPATARWTARKIGLDYRPDLITDRGVNLRLGTSYLKLVLDDFGGSMALATAAYNAGPGRPRRWREGPLLEPAVWMENIPFNETRDYVKKVLSNAAWYAARLRGEAPEIRPRLGPPIGPRGDTTPVNGELP